LFESLPQHFRSFDLTADVRTLLLLRKSMEKGLVNTLGDFYVVLKGIIVKNPTELGPYASAFYAYFLDIKVSKDESLDNAVRRSDAFNEWLDKLNEEERYDQENSMKDFVNKFLDEVHLTTYDIERVIQGEDILRDDDPNMKDENEQTDFAKNPEVNKMADYSNLSLEELRRRMEQVAKQQKHKHQGGSHWIGQYGNSPYGNGGAAKGGIRVGGAGGGKMARAVIGDPQFYPVDKKGILKDDNMDAALASLKGIEEETAEVILDIEKTINQGLKEGGLFLPYEKEKVSQKMQVLLLIDNGGYSMYPYVQSVRKLFSKMKTRFAHDLKVHYFHNTIYGGVYEDPARRKFISTKKLLLLDKNYSVFIIGDAAMAPYELDASSQEDWKKIKKKFKRIAWMNPMSERSWNYTMTTKWLMQIVPMYTLTPEGIEKAVVKMNKKRKRR
jgi:uncharacterized protein with von Willebrand factor type A (vWA) domain